MKLEIGVDIMRRILGGTIRTISKDETRQALSCLYIEASGVGLTAVSTDGHRLARYSCMLPYEAEGSGKVLRRSCRPFEARRPHARIRAVGERPLPLHVRECPRTSDRCDAHAIDGALPIGDPFGRR